MNNYNLNYYGWEIIKENKICAIWDISLIELNNGIGELFNEPIEYIYVCYFNDNKNFIKIKPNGKSFSINIDQKYVKVLYKYNHLCEVITIR